MTAIAGALVLSFVLSNPGAPPPPPRASAPPILGPVAASLERAARQADAEADGRTCKRRTPAGVWVDAPARNPTLVWIGVGLAAIGVTAAIAAMTWARESDLSRENINTRLYRDLAPCGTDPNATTLPIADCQTNWRLFTAGAVVGAGGGALIWYGAQPAPVPRPTLAVRVRF